jgi:hypothetical protein
LGVVHQRGVSTKCYKSVEKNFKRVSQGCHQSVTRVLQECKKSVTKVSQECYKRVTRVSHVRDKSATGVLCGVLCTS